MTLTTRAPELMRFLEALYDLEQPRDAWFRHTVRAASAAFDSGVGVGMLLYDVSGDSPRIDAIDGVNIARQSFEVSKEFHDTPHFTDAILSSYRTQVCATMEEHVLDAEVLRQARERYAEFGVADQVMVNGGNPDGFGCVLYIFSQRHFALSTEARLMLTRVASHLSSAYRLHRRLHGDPSLASGAVDAVLRLDGGVEHVESRFATKAALGSLSTAVGRREWAKSRTGRRDTERSLAAWQPLVAARWSLVDTYERSGVRYVTARENKPVQTGIHTLSMREQQVTSLAALGHSNKLIAYELGLAHSTVRVLFARAATKLGARTRSDVVARVRSAG